MEVSVEVTPKAITLTVDDAGSPLPASAKRSFLAFEMHAGQYGRPSGLSLFVAAELSASLGARLELSDVAVRETAVGTTGGGLRAIVTFPL